MFAEPKPYEARTAFWTRQLCGERDLTLDVKPLHRALSAQRGGPSPKPRKVDGLDLVSGSMKVFPGGRD